jgi:glyoxylase-like metal-dependent hydrolase (beta-lactamase superfamily II)/rhodanese-related sulfurtransferase
VITIEIVTFETKGLGDRTYLAHDGTHAVIVDPQRDIDRFLDKIEELGLTLTHVLETHVHNDYVTGGYALARRTAADYVLNRDEELKFGFTGVTDGDELTSGTMTIRVLHTPGHTPTHLSYVLAHDGEDRAVFTGGSLLFGTVGRTDLISQAATKDLTRDQFQSANRLVEELADDVAVQPTHGFGSFCSSADSDEDVNSSTIGREKQANVAFTVGGEDEFVAELIAGLDAYPRYYAHMGPMNRLGPADVDLSPPVPADPAQLRARIHAGEWVVDLRTRKAFAADHVAGTVNIELTESLATYLGWLMPWGRPVTLVGDTAEDVVAAQREIVRIGIDRAAAGAHGGIDRYGEGLDRSAYRVVTFEDVADARDAGEDPLILDTRRHDEWVEEHVEGAIHVPLHELPDRIDELPTDRDAWVHCASGFRAAIATSLLARSGRRPVLIDDEYERASKSGLSVLSA